MDTDESRWYTINVVRRHIKDMLEARGDDVSYIQEHGDAVEPERYYNEIITLDTNKTVVFFALNKAKDLKEREKTASDMVTRYEGRKNFIVVLQQAPSSPILNQFQARHKDLQKVGGMLHIFYVKELMFNPLIHVAVPKQRKLPQEQASKVIEDHKIRHKKLMPIISKDDIIARWLGLQVGDIVEITRHNKTSGTYYYYRCCM